MRSVWQVIRLIPEYRSRILMVLLASMTIGMASTALPFIVREIVTAISAFSNSHTTLESTMVTVGWLLGLFACVRIAIVIGNYFQERQSASLWLNTVTALRSRILDKLTKISLDYYEANQVGDISERFAAIPVVTMWIFQLSEGAMANLLQIGFALAVLLAKAPLIGLMMTLIVAVNMAVSLWEAKRNRLSRREQATLVGRMGGMISEMVSQISTIRGFTGENTIRARYEAIQSQWKVNFAAIKGLQRRSNLALGVMNMVVVLICAFLAVDGALKHAVSGGDVLLILLLCQSTVTLITPLSQFVNTTSEVESLAERLVQLFSVQAIAPDEPDAAHVTAIHSIEFRDVTFTYPQKPTPVLKNISFKLEQGQSLALVGPSGAGKSSIVKLLLRYYEPDSGTILINGLDVRTINQESLRAQIGLVPQDVALFNDTVENNIAFCRNDAQSDQIIRAAKNANAHDFVGSLSDGYQTVVGERGIKLSGGERQRIAIARAFLRDPSLIVLDEATSALDSVSERLVQESLAKLMSNRTSIMIAHRLSTTRLATLIMTVKDGQIVERGSHNSLVNLPNGQYAELYRLQSAQAA